MSLLFIPCAAFAVFTQSTDLYRLAVFVLAGAYMVLLLRLALTFTYCNDDISTGTATLGMGPRPPKVRDRSTPDHALCMREARLPAPIERNSASHQGLQISSHSVLYSRRRYRPPWVHPGLRSGHRSHSSERTKMFGHCRRDYQSSGRTEVQPQAGYQFFQDT